MRIRVVLRTTRLMGKSESVCKEQKGFLVADDVVAALNGDDSLGNPFEELPGRAKQ